MSEEPTTIVTREELTNLASMLLEAEDGHGATEDALDLATELVYIDEGYDEEDGGVDLDYTTPLTEIYNDN